MLLIRERKMTDKRFHDALVGQIGEFQAGLVEGSIGEEVKSGKVDRSGNYLVLTKAGRQYLKDSVMFKEGFSFPYGKDDEKLFYNNILVEVAQDWKGVLERYEDRRDSPLSVLRSIMILMSENFEATKKGEVSEKKVAGQEYASKKAKGKKAVGYSAQKPRAQEQTKETAFEVTVGKSEKVYAPNVKLVLKNPPVPPKVSMVEREEALSGPAPQWAVDKMVPGSDRDLIERVGRMKGTGGIRVTIKKLDEAGGQTENERYLRQYLNNLGKNELLDLENQGLVKMRAWVPFPTSRGMKELKPK
jgi:hypothetical protein